MVREQTDGWLGRKSYTTLATIGGVYLLGLYAPHRLLFRSSITTSIVLVVFELLAFLAYRVIVYPHFISPIRHFPTPPGASFFNGHFAKILKEPTGVPMREWLNTVPNDGIIYYKAQFNTERVLVASPKALADVLVNNSYDFVKPVQLAQTIGRILGIGILFAEGDEHKRQRKGLNPAFQFRHIKELYPILWSKSEEMVRAIYQSTLTPSGDDEKPSNIIEVSTFSNRAALDIIGVAGMSRDFNALKDPKNELYQIYNNIFTPSRGARIMGLIGLFIPISFLQMLPLKRNNDIYYARNYIRNVCLEMIQAKRKALESGEEKLEDKSNKDIITTAIASKAFTDENLVDQLMTFLAAGHETTATSMQWALLSLCQYPTIQTRLRSSLRTAGLCPLASPPDFNSRIPITSDIIDNIPYLHAFCLEVLRLYSPVNMTLRTTARATTIVGHPIPKGTTVILGISALNQNIALWGADAESFNPDRWLTSTTSTDPETGKETTVERVNQSGGAESNYAFLTFLHGPRSCIGQGFAKAEFACLVAAWVAAFESRFADEKEEEKYKVGAKYEIAGGVTAKPKGGVRVRVVPVVE